MILYTFNPQDTFSKLCTAIANLTGQRLHMTTVNEEVRNSDSFKKLPDSNELPFLQTIYGYINEKDKTGILAFQKFFKHEGK